MKQWENFSSSTTLHGCQRINSIQGFRLGYLAGKIDQLATEYKDATGSLEKLSALEKEWGVGVSFEAFPSTWR